MASIKQMRERLGSRVRQALAQSEVSLDENQREQLVADLTDGVLLAVHDLVGELASEEGIDVPAVADDEPAGQPAEEQTLWEGRPFLSLVEHYKITSERVRITRGLIGKGREDIELVRVQDIEHTQHMTERMLNIGDIIMHTADPDSPTVVLRNVNDPQEVHELLRRAVIEARRTNRMSYRENM